VSGTDLYAGGFFSTAGGYVAKYIARWNGSAWIAQGSGVNNYVYAVAVSGTNIYVGGSFTQAGGYEANYIALWNGSAWTTLGSGTNGTVYALAVSGTGDLYVGGSFTSPGNNIARWTGSSWTTLGTSPNDGTNSTVRAIAIIGSSVYVGGSFTQAGAVNRNRIARWSGSGWYTVGTAGAGGVNSTVYALAASGSNLYVGGAFTAAESLTVNYIVRWTGSDWMTVGSAPNIGVNSTVLALAVSGTDLYAGGFFSTAGGNPATYIAKWNGSAWSALGSGVNSYVYSLAVSGTNIYVGGLFSQAGGNPAAYIAKWNGSAWSALGSGANYVVLALAVSGTGMYVGGGFTQAGGKPSLYFGRWIGALPGARKKVDFNGDGQEDILWRYYGAGGYNCAWFMGTGGAGAGLQALDSGVVNMLQAPVPSMVYWDARHAVDPLNRTADKLYRDARVAGGILNRTMDKLYRDAREAGGIRSQRGAGPVREGSFGNLEQRMGIQTFTSPLKNMISLLAIPILGGANLPAIADLGWHIDGTGDFNGDGQVDILWRYYGPGGYNCVWFMNGTTIIGGANLPAIADLGWQFAGTGDFNGDGQVDILWRYIGPGGYNCVWFMNGTTVTGGVNLPAVDDSNWTIAGNGDFNGDGNLDILWRYIGPGGSSCVWFMNGTTIIGGANMPAVSDLSWTIVGTGDFNGDGKVDILWRYYGPGGYSCVWFMNGTTITGGADLPAVADLGWRIVNH
jgi:hypothetical protein